MEFEVTEVAQALGLSVNSPRPGHGLEYRFAQRRHRAICSLPCAVPITMATRMWTKCSARARWRQSRTRLKPGTVLVVPDTLAALQSTATWALRQWGGEVIGVTGSAGKTSTKDVIAAMLAVGVPVGKTIGNLNNHVGVPLSILRLPGEARVAVLEMGMNHPGEIRELCAIAHPRIGVVTNVGYAHMWAFDSIEGVAAAKRELIESLPADGVAVLNADDPLVSKFREVHRNYTITFGINSPADIRADDVQLSDHGVSFKVDGVPFESALIGRHSVLNILAGLAVASLYGIRPAQLTEVVRDLSAPPMRGQRMVHDGVVILNDCYNSSPDAARAMIDVLRDTPAQRRIAVLGEMLELGAWSESLHRDLGSYAAANGIDLLARNTRSTLIIWWKRRESQE